MNWIMKRALIVGVIAGLMLLNTTSQAQQKEVAQTMDQWRAIVEKNAPAKPTAKANTRPTSIC